MSINENINVLFDRFESFIKNETIVGQEIKVGEVTIIPMANISFGLGAGSGGEYGKEEGGGTGMFARATPTALLVVQGGDVNLIPIRKGSSFDGLLESVPGLIEKLSKMKPEEKESVKKEENE